MLSRLALAPALLLLTLLSANSQATVPQDLAYVLQQCKTFTKLAVEATVSQGYKDADKPFLLAARPTWFMADILWGNRNHFAYQSNQLTMHTVARSQPEIRIEGVMAKDLFDACRNGFPGTTWQVRRPDEDGYMFRITQNNWFRAELPYSWAVGFRPFLGLNRQDGSLIEIVWEVSPGDWAHVSFATLDWNAPDTPPFNRSSPPTEIKRPAKFVNRK